uniref:Contactin associated protein-like 5a n=1 Tax=Amphilophus citrinellus TaxID=61819 RepID=A0A3Q0T1B6_AMPCI
MAHNKRPDTPYSPFWAHMFSVVSGAGGWSPTVTDPEPWLQVDLRDRMEVTAVATQGRYDSSDWVSRYLLLFSDTGQAWKQLRQGDGIGRFVGNVNSEAVAHNKLSQSVRTRFLRFIPVDWSPSGWLGLRVEVYGCAYKSDVADFDGRSSLLYRFNQKSLSTVKDVISLRFKSHQAEGVLLHGEGQRGDYITLELHRGKLALYLKLGEPVYSSSRVAVTVGSLLDDQHWHSVIIERFNKQVNLTVDSHTLHFQTKGEGDSLEVDYELSFGGIPLPGKPGTFLRKNFHGCIENLYYNGINIIDLAKRRKPQIYSVGNVTFSCSWPQLVACTFLSSSSSFMSLPMAVPSAIMEGFSIRFQFRTWNSDGMLFSARLSPEPQKLELNIKYGKIHKLPSVAGHRVNDGLWHTVNLDTRRLQITLTLDNELASTIEQWEQLETQGSFYFGGQWMFNNPNLAFQGCMRLIIINGHPINLSHVQQGLLGNYKELQFDTCNIRDRCLPNLCQHGGRCWQSWNSFSCDCSGTGYSGATCHTSIYESSCEAYKVIGSPSGFYSIDPDGSGPLGSILVYCNMTEERVWTVMTHNVTGPIRVQGSSLQKPHVMVLNYSASVEQLYAMISGSEQCHQEVVYNCRKLPSKDLQPWLTKGEKRTYWGGFLPGVQQCSCSLEENCVDMNYFCNCDADKDTWATDTGILSYKDHLPVSHMVIGDTNRTDSEAIYQIGPLRCYGDKSMWNAVSFYQESSSLVFPTLQVELASDISFYFKTSAFSGVFLENLGHTDFIRVELSSPAVVTFSFDVGNGPVVVAVKSHLPLNDRQWHYVRAERNVKEASLQVDQLPFRFLDAPADGHYRLHLNSQLFVGSASERRGFLGCIRTLTINGVTYDLEERATMTAGVTSGCPGYCSGSSSLCHNSGKCIEKSSGYACDCSQSAYGGPTCREGELQSACLDYFEDFPNPTGMPSIEEAESGDKGDDLLIVGEDVAFSFITSQNPAMLLSVSTFGQQYIAVILARNGSLQIWYHLQMHRSPDMFSPILSNLADGQLHRVRIHREGKDLYVQVTVDMLSKSNNINNTNHLSLGRDNFEEEIFQVGSEGFMGCLSSVQFNHVAPLKAALLNRGSSLVTIRGPLVQSNCGALSDSITSHNLRGNTKTSTGQAVKKHEQKVAYTSKTGKVLTVVTAISNNYSKLFTLFPSKCYRHMHLQCSKSKNNIIVAYFYTCNCVCDTLRRSKQSSP